MNNFKKATIGEHFSTLPDPRSSNKRHKLIDIVTITICAVICGADTWDQIEEYGHAKYDWFKEFLELPYGIPSHDTFNNFFSKIDPEEFRKCFINWVQSIFKLVCGQSVAIDGKTLRRSHDNSNGKAAIHMVSAWASANNLVLGQIKTNEKSNEITAIPELLKLIEIEGAIITIDAMGCQKNIAKTIIDNGGDYALDLKENQETFRGSMPESTRTGSSPPWRGAGRAPPV